MLISLAESTELNSPVEAEYFICLVSYFSASLSNEQPGMTVLICCSAAMQLCLIGLLKALCLLFHSFCSLSESFFMVKGAALFLQQGSSQQGQKAHPHHKHAGKNHKAQHSKSNLLITSTYPSCGFDLFDLPMWSRVQVI